MRVSHWTQKGSKVQTANESLMSTQLQPVPKSPAAIRKSALKKMLQK